MTMDPADFPTRDDYLQAYDEGTQDFYGGATEAEVPYGFYDFRRKPWLEGWTDAAWNAWNAWSGVSSLSGPRQ